MKKRIITGIIMAVILIPAVIVPELIRVLDVILLGAGVIASFELLNMYDKEKKLHWSIKLINVIFTLLLYVAIVNGDAYRDKCADSLIVRWLNATHFVHVITPLNVILTMFIVILAIMILNSSFTVSDAGKILVSIIYIGVGLGSFTVLRYFGVRFIVYLLLITVSTDIFALVFGMLLGKHKMAPQISPKKTWEGAIGGSFVAIVIGTVFLLLYEYFSSVFHNGVATGFFDGVFNYSEFTSVGKFFFAVTLTLFISVCGQIGDLVASKLKRTYGIKDYSNLFPGHGGILDRFDSCFFASAIFLAFMISEMNIFGVVI